MRNIIFVRYVNDEISIEIPALPSADSSLLFLYQYKKNGCFKGGTADTTGAADF